MSGGSMDYLYSRIESDANFELNTPERRAFKAHLEKVVKALHDIEWVDSGDYGQGEETEAILACLSDSAVLLAPLVEEGYKVLKAISKEIKNAKNRVA